MSRATPEPLATLSSGRPVIRLLFFTREPFPLRLVDVDVLFGRELIGRGHHIDFVMLADTSWEAADRPLWHGRPVFLAQGPRGGGLPSRVLREAVHLWHDLRHLLSASRRDYDAIQIRDKFLIGSLGLLIARWRGLKFFFWLSFPYPQIDLQYARERRSRWPALNYLRGTFSGLVLYRWILPHSDQAFVQSEQMKRELCAHGVDPARLTAVPMGVDLSDLPPATHVARRDGAKVVLGYLGALAAERRLLVLVDMLAQLRSQGVDAHLLLVGGAYVPEDVRAIEERAALLGVAEQMEITGMLPRARALERIREAHIALSPIYPSEVFRVSSPTKLIEYLALRIPVVANDIPEQKSVLRASRAGVCAPWGAGHFARAVRWLLGHPRELEKMGVRGREWVESNRSYTRIADAVERRYLELLPREAS
ncbi:MAG TPA: glycosyltransferase [Steroidobacteraceae bacterium]|nr:glycosyltransferase [Steroidobacteraceae bacterium]